MKNLAYYIAKMQRGKSVKIAVFGDSTVDGDRTTNWKKNAVDANGDAIGMSNHNLEAPNSWPVLLEGLLQAMFNHRQIHVFNAGYGGKSAVTGWAIANYDRAITNNPYYGHCDICFVDFGLNDMASANFNIDAYRDSLKMLAQSILGKGTLPILLSSDSTLLSSTESVRGHKDVALMINRIKEDVANDLNLPYFNKHDIVKDVLSHSDESWLAAQWDNLHFSDLGHRIKASAVASYLYQDLFYADKNKFISPFDSRANSPFIGYKVQKAGTKFGGNLYIPAEVVNKNLDQAVIDAWVWVDNDQHDVIYHSIMSDGNLSDVNGGSRLSITNYSLGQTIYDGETFLNGTGNAPVLYTDYPALYGTLLPGLNRIKYTLPKKSITTPKWCGYFELKKLQTPQPSTQLIEHFNQNIWLVNSANQNAAICLSKKTTLAFTAKLNPATGIVFNSVKLLDKQNGANQVGLMIFKNGQLLQLYTVYRGEAGNVWYTLIGNLDGVVEEEILHFIVQTSVVETGIKLAIYVNEKCVFSDITLKGEKAKYPLSGIFGGYYISSNAPKTPHVMFIKHITVAYQLDHA